MSLPEFAALLLDQKTFSPHFAKHLLDIVLKLFLWHFYKYLGQCFGQLPGVARHFKQRPHGLPLGVQAPKGVFASLP